MNGNTLQGFQFSDATAKLLASAENKGYDAWAHACKEGAKAGLAKQPFFDALRAVSAMRFNDQVLFAGLKLAKEGATLATIVDAMKTKAEERAAKARADRAAKRAEKEATEAQVENMEASAQAFAILAPNGEQVKKDELAGLLNGIDRLSDDALIQYRECLKTAILAVHKEIKSRAALKAGNVSALTAENHPLTAALKAGNVSALTAENYPLTAAWKAGNFSALTAENHPLTAEELKAGEEARRAEREARKAAKTKISA